VIDVHGLQGRAEAGAQARERVQQDRGIEAAAVGHPQPGQGTEPSELGQQASSENGIRDGGGARGRRDRTSGGGVLPVAHQPLVARIEQGVDGQTASSCPSTSSTAP